MGKGGIDCNEQFLFFPAMFSTLSKHYSPILLHFEMSSASFFQIGTVQNLLFGNYPANLVNFQRKTNWEDNLTNLRNLQGYTLSLYRFVNTQKF